MLCQGLKCCKRCVPLCFLIQVQLNLSTKASLGTEENGLCREGQESMYGLSARKSGRPKEVAVRGSLTIKPFWGKFVLAILYVAKNNWRKNIWKLTTANNRPRKRALSSAERDSGTEKKNFVLWTHRVLSIEDIEYIVLLIVHIGYFRFKWPLPIVNFPTERKLQAEISLFNGKRT